MGPLTSGSTGPITLAPGASPRAKLIGMTLVCLFWNGIVSVFVFQVVTSWASGRGEVCLTVFMVPFVAVGVGLVAGTFYTLLALFNPRCSVTLDRHPALGRAVEVRWNFTGRYDRIYRLDVRVEGREEATYRQGTNTRTDKNVFHIIGLVETSRAVDVRAGKARLTLPADTMHSFAAANNKIAWALIVHGHIQGWPDVKDEYALAVAPLPAGRLEQADEQEEPEEDDEPEAEDESGEEPGETGDGDANREQSWT